MDIKDIGRTVRDQFNSRAAELADDGRNQRLWQHQDSPTPEQYTDDLVRWAFFNQTRRMDCQANRESTDDAYFRETLMWVIDAVRRDEQRRVGELLANGLTSMLGDGAYGIVRNIAEGMKMFDD